MTSIMIYHIKTKYTAIGKLKKYLIIRMNYIFLLLLLFINKLKYNTHFIIPMTYTTTTTTTTTNDEPHTQEKVEKKLPCFSNYTL